MNASPLGFAMRTSTAVREIDVSRKVRSSKCLSKLQIIYEFKHQSIQNITLSNQSKDCVTELSVPESRNVKCNLSQSCGNKDLCEIFLKEEVLSEHYTILVTRNFAENFKRSKNSGIQKCSKLNIVKIYNDKYPLKTNLRPCQI